MTASAILEPEVETLATSSDRALCDGCTCCESNLVLCSNMRVSDLALGTHSADDGCYRLTAGDIVFFTELES